MPNKALNSETNTNTQANEKHTDKTTKEVEKKEQTKEVVKDKTTNREFSILSYWWVLLILAIVYGFYKYYKKTLLLK